MKGKLLNYIEAMRAANCEEDYDILFDIMNPTPDEDEMGKKYDEVLGYNPITYFDDLKVKDLISEVNKTFNTDIDYNDLLENIRESIGDSKIYAIGTTTLDQLLQYDIFDDEKLKSKLKSLIADKLGFEELEILDEVEEDDSDDDIIGFDDDDDEE